ncbi:MAG: DUF1036 domain-containing protein, partial [Synechococcus sp. SB0663_bin_10]|nr:DUF1036 domain-containing protein [Synechococcus sp. SB0663_bin_10]
MIHPRQCPSTQQGHVDQNQDLPFSQDLPNSFFPLPMKSKTVVGLCAVLVGLVFSLGLSAKGQSNFQCDEAVLGKDYCDQLRTIHDANQRQDAYVRKQLEEEAGFSICNKSSYSPVYIAYGYKNSENQWASRGFWRLNRGKCEKIINGPVSNKEYYLYAVATETDYLVPIATWGT